MMERFESWPELRLTLYPLPWTWAVNSWWLDKGMTRSFYVRVGPIGIEWWSN